jgi:hypothetical protein
MRRRVCVVAASLVPLVACEQATEASRASGGVTLEVVAMGGQARALDSGRVHVEGPTPRVVRATPGSPVTIEELQPGTYTVSLQGFVGDQVERFGRAGNVVVVAGQTRPVTVTFDRFVPALEPVTLSDDGHNLIVAFSPLALADSYRVQVDDSETFASPEEQTITGSEASYPIALPLGARFVRVQAFDPYQVPGVPTATRPVRILDLAGNAALDGWAESGGGAQANGGGPLVGDLESATPGLGFRQFFSFDFTPLAPAEEVTGAVLTLFQASASDAPYASLGNVIVDHLDYGPTLDGADYNLPPLIANIGTISDDAVEEFKQLPVTAQVRADRTAGRVRSQFRLRFQLGDIDFDGASDFVQFGDVEVSCCIPDNPPLLRVVVE